MNSFHPSCRVSCVRRAFTLVEIMVVVTIIGLLAILALPAAMRVRESAQNSRFASDLRIHAQAFESYAVANGGWPPNAGGGAVPTGMADLLRAGSWSVVNSVGGRWNWDFNNAGVTAGVSSTGVTASNAQMTLIDAKIDDGNLSTGQFQQIGARFIYILEP